MSLRTAVLSPYAFVMLLGSLLLACDEEETPGLSDQPSRGTAPINTDCAQDSQCRSGVCLHGGAHNYDSGFCSRSCDLDNDDCEKDPTSIDMFCGMAGDGRAMCARCDGFGFACGLDQAPVACELLDETHCGECGCPDGLHCIPGQGCRPVSAVGEPCWKDADCESSNCSSFAGVCRVAVGASCTHQDCDLCYIDNDKPGWSFCQKECTEEQCPPPFCSRDAASVYQALCQQCPTVSYCPAEMPNSTGCALSDQFRNYACAEQYVTRATGQPCTDSRQCASKTCLTKRACVGFGSNERCWPVGYCTSACSASTDCPEGTLCAQTCTGDKCELRCMRSCERFDDCPTGHCESATAADDSAGHVCEPRAKVGEYCTRDSDCITTICNRPGTAYASCGNARI
jgi:hypothetical protein